MKMPRIRSSEKTDGARITIRLDEESNLFYRAKAQKRGMSVSELLRQAVVEGIVSENIAEIESRLQAHIKSIAAVQSLVAEPALSRNVLNAIFTVEEALKEIVHQRDPQGWFSIQKRASDKVDKELAKAGQVAKQPSE
jgi:hypothetical protein